MAHITKEETKNIRDLLKKEFPKYKFSVVNCDNSSIYICLICSDLDLSKDLKKGYLDADREIEELERIKKGHLTINTYTIKEKWKGKTVEVFEKVLEIAKSQNWHGNTDSLRIAYYIDISFGKYGNPHRLISV